MIQVDEIKKLTGYEAAKKVQPGMTIGIGTGTTAYWCIVELGKRI
jgi:ribose 5-phosphate isomerase A